MSWIRPAAVGLAVAGLGVLAVPPATAAASTPVATLTQIRAIHHPGHDLLIFRFRGPVPTFRVAEYVKRVSHEGSGRRVRVVGSAKMVVVLFQATGIAAHGTTYGPTRRAFALPNLIQLVGAGEDEHHMRFGVGLARKEPFRMFTRTDPSRVIIDVRTPFRTVSARDYFLNKHRFETGHQPYTQAVSRPVIPPGVAFGALQRLFARPTLAEHARGLRFVSSLATGFTNLRIGDGVARVQLTGTCSSGGSTFTIANEIMPTLKQFPSVRWVKIYSPAGHTERPDGHTDSIPACLEP